MTAVSSTVRLDAVRFTTLEIVSMVRPMYSEDPEPLRAPHADELHIRHMIHAWGRTCREELRCPSTWWQHLKHTLRKRWPRLFWRLTVRYDVSIAENGAIVSDLDRTIGAQHRIIPYRMPTTEYPVLDDPSNDH